MLCFSKRQLIACEMHCKTTHTIKNKITHASDCIRSQFPHLELSVLLINCKWLQATGGSCYKTYSPLLSPHHFPCITSWPQQKKCRKRTCIGVANGTLCTFPGTISLRSEVIEICAAAFHWARYPGYLPPLYPTPLDLIANPFLIEFGSTFDCGRERLWRHSDLRSCIHSLSRKHHAMSRNIYLPNGTSIARVFRRDSHPTRSRRSEGSGGGESSSMLTNVEGNAVQAFSMLV
jgi:hypothetical protein